MYLQQLFQIHPEAFNFSALFWAKLTKMEPRPGRKCCLCVPGFLVCKYKEADVSSCTWEADEDAPLPLEGTETEDYCHQWRDHWGHLLHYCRVFFTPAVSLLHWHQSSDLCSKIYLYIRQVLSFVILWSSSAIRLFKSYWTGTQVSTLGLRQKRQQNDKCWRQARGLRYLKTSMGASTVASMSAMPWNPTTVLSVMVSVQEKRSSTSSKMAL